MQAQGSLSPEQKSALEAVFRFVQMSVVYFRSILPVVGEVDERLLKALVELAETCQRNLTLFFPELQPLSEDRKNRGGGR